MEQEVGECLAEYPSIGWLLEASPAAPCHPRIWASATTSCGRLRLMIWHTMGQVSGAEKEARRQG